ncbi:hypothetical protein KBD81_03240 [Candidatus Woesebacteria bacterium]|nr:hypothetical protein [Candidatus Woesebacteria bacterium]
MTNFDNEQSDLRALELKQIKTPDSKESFILVDHELHTAALELRKAVTENESNLLDFIYRLNEVERLLSLYNSDPVGFRTKIFTSASKLGISNEAIHDLQRKIIELDTKLADAYAQSSFSEIASAINDPTKNLLTPAEAHAIINFDQNLDKNPAANAKYAEMVGSENPPSILLETQRERLNNLFFGSPLSKEHEMLVTRIAATTVSHQSAVASLIRDFSGSKFLALVAEVHDLFKYVVPSQRHSNYMELALHEVASAKLGSIIITSLANYLNEDEHSTPELISGISKLVLKLIGVHGSSEYPQVTSAQSPVFSEAFLKQCGLELPVTGYLELSKTQLQKSSLNRLLGNLYPVMVPPSAGAFVEEGVEQAYAEQIRAWALALNAADHMEGASLHSFDRYNLAYTNDAICDNSEISAYLKSKILKNINGSYTNPSLIALGWESDARLVKKMNFMKMQSALLLHLFESNDQDIDTAESESPKLKNLQRLADQVKSKFNVLKDSFVARTKDMERQNDVVMARQDFDEAFSALLNHIATTDLDKIIEKNPLFKTILEDTWTRIERS